MDQSRYISNWRKVESGTSYVILRKSVTLRTSVSSNQKVITISFSYGCCEDSLR